MLRELTAAAAAASGQNLCRFV